MHYKNGRLAVAGDSVIHLPSYGHPQAGFIVDLRAAADSCNCCIATERGINGCVTVSDCLHVDDVKAAFIHITDSKVKKNAEAIAETIPPVPMTFPPNPEGQLSQILSHNPHA